MTPDTYCMSFNPRVKKKKETEQYFGEAMNTLEQGCEGMDTFL